MICIATSSVFDLVICTLQTEVAFCLDADFSLQKMSELLLDPTLIKSHPNYENLRSYGIIAV